MGGKCYSTQKVWLTQKNVGTLKTRVEKESQLNLAEIKGANIGISENKDYEF